MAEYLAMRIKQGKLRYEDVIRKYPELKDEIDRILAEDET